MPAWSTDIAKIFIWRGAKHGRAFDQMQLQKLVYIAHGWRLAASGEPLTGDRPEAWDLGPMYRRLAEALASAGWEPVLEIEPGTTRTIGATEIESELDASELRVIDRVISHYGHHPSVQLAALTRGQEAPWASVYRAGAGRFRDIPHVLVRDQFVSLSRKIDGKRGAGAQIDGA